MKRFPEEVFLWCLHAERRKRETPFSSDFPPVADQEKDAVGINNFNPIRSIEIPRQVSTQFPGIQLHEVAFDRSTCFRDAVPVFCTWSIMVTWSRSCRWVCELGSRNCDDGLAPGQGEEHVCESDCFHYRTRVRRTCAIPAT